MYKAAVLCMVYGHTDSKKGTTSEHLKRIRNRSGTEQEKRDSFRGSEAAFMRE